MRLVYLLIGAALAAPIGCGGSGDDPCAQMVQHVDECGGTGSSQSLDGLNCEDEVSACIAACVTNAPCEQVNDLSGPKGQPVNNCIMGCQG